MKLRYIIISSIFAILMGMSSCNNSTQHNESSHEEHNHAQHEGEEEHSEGGDEIVLSPAKATKLGVKSSKIALGEFNNIIKVSGEILPSNSDVSTVTAISSGIVKIASNINPGIGVKAGQLICSISAKGMTGGDANESAKVSYLAAKQELERIKPLYKEKIITEREYILAKENYEKARLAYNPSTASGSSAQANITGTITQLFVTDGQYVEAGTPIATVSKNARLVLRADLPEKYYSELASIKSANFKTTTSQNILSTKDMNGRVISSPNSTANGGYIPVFIEFTNNGSVTSGSFAEIYLIGGKNKSNTLAIPVTSLTEELGKYYAYIKLDEECYDKRLVTIGDSDGQRVEILSGLKAGEEVVTEGAVFIKLASNSTAIPEGCSHNH